MPGPCPRLLVTRCIESAAAFPEPEEQLLIKLHIKAWQASANESTTGQACTKRLSTSPIPHSEGCVNESAQTDLIANGKIESLLDSKVETARGGCLQHMFRNPQAQGHECIKSTQTATWLCGSIAIAMLTMTLQNILQDAEVLHCYA